MMRSLDSRLAVALRERLVAVQRLQFKSASGGPIVDAQATRLVSVRNEFHRSVVVPPAILGVAAV